MPARINPAWTPTHGPLYSGNASGTPMKAGNATAPLTTFHA